MESSVRLNAEIASLRYRNIFSLIYEIDGFSVNFTIIDKNPEQKTPKQKTPHLF
jgi:hypothetical protein